MLRSQHSVFSVRAKTGEVVSYHNDGDQPGKPLHILIPGGFLALATLAMMFWIAYLTWYQASIPRSNGLIYLLALTLIYMGSVFLFSYAYELYDLSKAIRLTVFLVFFSAAALVIAAVLFALLSKNEGSSSSSSHESSSSSWSTGTSLGWSGGRGGPMDLDSGGVGTSTWPKPITCFYCRASNVPSADSSPCPNCGAARRRATDNA